MYPSWVCPYTLFILYELGSYFFYSFSVSFQKNMLVILTVGFILFLQLCQLALLTYICYRVVQDKNAAVTFCKSVWFQLQEDFLRFGLQPEK